MSSLPERAADTSADNPWPLRLLSMKISDYVDKMSVLWVEGQVVQLNRRPGSSVAYLTLRDTDADMSMSVSIRVTALDAMRARVEPGLRVVLQAKPEFWPARGSLMLDARQIRPVGVGELLARIEHLKQVLATEGLFAAERKRPLPFLPRRVGLICGRASAAEKDVVENARKRWPAVEFEIRTVAVQGANAVTEVAAALAELDGMDEVDVIVITRGGGSVEDLLPFSNEALVRAVAAARTPVVSAIGHEVDAPLLDLVADRRASTPTDAAKLVVPDAAAEHESVAMLRERARRTLGDRIRRGRQDLVAVRSRPVLADRTAYVRVQREGLAHLRGAGLRTLLGRIHREQDRVEHLRRQARVLSPQSTLDRGYALVSTTDGEVVRSPDVLDADQLLRVRVAEGDFAVRTIGAGADATASG